MASITATLRSSARPARAPWLPRALAWARSLLGRRSLEPSYPVLPAVDEHGQSTVPGVYLVGEVAGTPLIKLGLNSGHELVEHLAPEILEERKTKQDDVLDLLIVGAGAAGLGAAARAKELGLEAVTVDANHVAETIYTMTKGKLLLAEPTAVANRSSMWFEECTKEELLKKWHEQIPQLGLDVREFEKVTDIQRQAGYLKIETQKAEYRARRVILAVGKAGNPRKAGVKGEVEHAERIAHRLLDPDDFQNRNILIYGGGDVALEAALHLCDTNKVALATIDKEFTFPKKRNVDALKAKEDQGKVTVHMDSHLVEVGERDVTIAEGGRDGPRQSIANDFVFEMIGAELPTPFFKKIGIKLENAWDVRRWLYLAAAFLFVYSFYALKSYGKGVSGWPYSHLVPPDTYDAALQAIFRWAFLPFGWLFTDRAFADIMSDHGYQQGYLYSFLYTIVMVTFGYQAMMRWRGVARDKRYQTYRYLTLLAFQVTFFLIVNVVAVQALSVKYAWRAWGLYQPYPLFFNTFFWWYDGDPKWIMTFFVGAGLVGTLVAIPIASRKHGKRFCTWVCGCGGLAETLGDRWRHLSAKGKRSRSWEFQGAVVLAASIVIALVVIGVYETDGNNGWWRAYSYIVDFWLVAVIPIAMYPFFGGKVWCRYWCPLAAYNGILAKWYGKLKIVSDEKCISCTQCSKYCQVGVDVMAFAKNQQA
ncbi:MAG: NAD(P)-binding domain-containing protein, partial [Candidatus Krumholzibacteria bacterium]|nr:NAD(P)-binding domain-containing protein [Candidatus Krumholzibacteria bacterium]